MILRNNGCDFQELHVLHAVPEYFYEVKQMTQYYTLLQSRSHAFILVNRFKIEGVPCELTYMPREIMKDLCNMGVRFTERDFARAINVIRRSGLPGCRVYQEIFTPNDSTYLEIDY